MIDESIAAPMLEHWNKVEEKAKRRSAMIWSASSIVGYIWDVIRNLIIITIVLGIFSTVSGPEDIIIISVLILIYLNLTTIGAQLAQMVIKTHLRMDLGISEILKKLGKEDSEEEKEDFEQTTFLLEKALYKFYLNGFFSFLIFIIVVLNLLGALG